MNLSQSSDARSVSALVTASDDGSFSQEDSGAISTDSAESLRLRTEMMLCLRQHIDQQRWSLTEACRVLGQPSPRMQHLLNGEIGRFSLEDLIDLLTTVGLKVEFSVFPARLPNPTKLVKNGPDETSLYH